MYWRLKQLPELQGLSPDEAHSVCQYAQQRTAWTS